MYFGEGNGTPLQYSCLENPMDGGAWWAAVPGVARSRTRLSDFTHSLSWPHTCKTFCIINIYRHSICFNDECMLTSHPKSVLTLRFTWCCIFYTFGQMHNDINPSLYNHTENFHCSKILCDPTVPLSPLP